MKNVHSMFFTTFYFHELIVLSDVRVNKLLCVALNEKKDDNCYYLNT